MALKQIRTLVPQMGPCIASDRITVDGERVGSMSVDPVDEENPVGWTFLSGDETQDYVDDASNFDVYDVNTIANYDPDIIPYLYALPGQRFDREDGGGFVEASDSRPKQRASGLPAGVRVVQGKVLIAKGWTVELPVPFRRRLEDGCDVLWRPGLTFWIEVVDGIGGSVDDCLQRLKAGVPKEASDVQMKKRRGLVEFSYRLREKKDNRAAALYGFVVRPSECVRLAAYFDREADVAAARTFLQTVSRKLRRVA